MAGLAGVVCDARGAAARRGGKATFSATLAAEDAPDVKGNGDVAANATANGGGGGGGAPSPPPPAGAVTGGPSPPRRSARRAPLAPAGRSRPRRRRAAGRASRPRLPSPPRRARRRPCGWWGGQRRGRSGRRARHVGNGDVGVEGQAGGDGRRVAANVEVGVDGVRWGVVAAGVGGEWWF
ncbi:hypothetical protein BU14_0981s0002 [Porphyra umbilicalis]|uniref:Uncharacterized protein n=1 Tax=Porphyra umbilicalis TaxID=2786 RepID=A0A1X6NN17_PORUM|nr:hypothetical protein BU14_0981s0002 [Porphyra umbilicalis]|eukprot:OSX69962.1 hypothetical protein BU14_0981s0002 [Porphyra umbilicalis]